MTRLASRSVGAKQLVNEALRRLDNLRYNSTTGEWNYRIEPEGTPQTIDWKRWLGPAPNRLFSAERYFRFRKYWDYSGGIATDLFYHGLAPLVYAMGGAVPHRRKRLWRHLRAEGPRGARHLLNGDRVSEFLHRHVGQHGPGGREPASPDGDLC